MDAKKKAIIFAFIGFITFGLANTVYMYIWSDKLVYDHNNKIFYPIREIVINVFTLGVYGIFWTYRAARTLDLREGYETFTVNSLVSTVISACPLRSLSMALIYYRIASLKAALEY
jgi:hypothetical protein